MSSKSFTAELNPEQMRAATTIEGALLIIAGAGSGKTRVITHRIAHMLQNGISQSSILALTFTNKAAKEMQERVKDYIHTNVQKLTIATFHSFGVKILKQDIDKLGWRQNFSIYDETDKGQLIKESAKELNMLNDNFDVYKMAGFFSNIKTKRKKWEKDTEIYKKLYDRYQDGLKIYNALDFDDLIVLPIQLFTEYPEVLQKYKNKYRYIMIDEFQDTSLQQYELIHLLADNNIAVVGDDDQSIYSWRGANYENIRMFEKDFPHVQEIRLEQNYRSTETILAAANGVIAHNTKRKEKALWSGNGSGKPIELFELDDEQKEADYVAEMIQSLSYDEKRKYDDFGILMRTNTLSRHVEEALLAQNIPYVMSGGTSFFQRQEIKDILSYLRVCANQNDNINLLRIINTPKRGIGRKSIEKLNTIVQERHCSLWQAIEYTLTNTEDSEAMIFDSQDPAFNQTEKPTNFQEFYDFILKWKTEFLSNPKNLAKKVRSMVEECDYWSYLVHEHSKNEEIARYKYMNIDSLIQSIQKWEENPYTEEKGLYAYLNRISLLSQSEAEETFGQGKVNLMTIHAAKGLEFPVVFIIACEKGIIPHERSIEESEENIEEERRLFYVAITRARDKLFISTCKNRKKGQSILETEASPFLQEIPAELITYAQKQNTELTTEQLNAEFMKLKERLGKS